MIKIENPKYKSAFLTLLFYIILIFLIIIRYKIIPSGNGMMMIETVAPIVLPLIVLVLFFKIFGNIIIKPKRIFFRF